MHTYVDLYFTSESVSPLEISERVKRIAGLSFIIGRHDLEFDWADEADFKDRLSRIHEALKGTGVLYRVETLLDAPEFVAVPWPPPLNRSDPVHPGY